MKSLIGRLHLVRNLVSAESIIYQYWNTLLAPREVRQFTKKHLRFSPRVTKAIKRKTPRYDRYLLRRSPKLDLSLNNDNKINFDTYEMYKPDLEIRINRKPYIALFNALNKVLSEIQPESITEIGCSSGPLLEILSEHYPATRIQGIEGFQFYKESASSSIRNKIHIADLRRPLLGIDTSDLTICLEVAEHIDPEMLDVFLNNVYSSTSKWLIMSWSSTYPLSDAPPQHISPVSLRQYKRIMREIGFKESKFLTSIFVNESLKYDDFQEWWRKSGIVWEKTE